MKPVTQDIPAEFADAAQQARSQLVELAVEADDDLMMKYLDGGVAQEELEGLLGKAIASRVIVPVFAGSCVREEGVISLMSDVAEWFPTMADYGRVPLVNGEELDISPDDDRPVAFVFKTLQDPQNEAVLHQGARGHGHAGHGARERAHAQGRAPGPLYRMRARHMEDVKSVASGDLCVVPKLDAMTGDTLSVTGKVEAAEFRYNSRSTAPPSSRTSAGARARSPFLEKAADADPTIQREPRRGHGPDRHFRH